MAKYFEFSKHGTNFKRETVAGITTFLAMAYILVVNPLILGEAGMELGAVFTATAIAAIIGTLMMGIVAKYPIALAPGMGLNAFFAYSVVIGMGIPWEQALVGVFISGFIFLILAITGIREAIINAIPSGLKYAVAAGIGLFIAFIGLKNAGIIVDNPATLVSLGSFEDPATLLGLFGIVITAILMTRKLTGAIFYGILVTAIVGMIFGVVSVPEGIVSAPPSPEAFGALFEPLLSAETYTGTMIIVIFTFLFVDFFDTAGTLVGVANQANLMKNGKLPRAGRALAADSVATMAGAVAGTSTTTSYIESSSGVAAGGRTGFASVITAVCFGLALFIFPVLSVFTDVGAVTAPALVMVGVLMASSLGKIEWEKIEEAVPAFVTVIAMPLTFSIATGIALGFILYPLTKVFKGEGRKVHWIMYVLFFVFILYFMFLREG
ncbi:NCS2 family permease [Chengkuizengella axinellae]|uniref:NCS2 family permease n=1 Tax=Chengkuizengella axinellae TaxID=3064388 RepID=A0ABT9IZS5_9BACL|nr:NCS2 family permease [Chengkuizengella sp. 2205SS18-9]MDP5274871.1 NCS2 family permease [Chengkuizengella sp. 2205SS18-9]